MAASSQTAGSYFQGGDYVELLSAQGKAPASTWKLQGKIVKSFDKAIKGNAFQMDGSSETKMQLPKAPTSSTSSLGLTQRFLVLQLLVPHTRSFSLEVGFSDFQKIRRRLLFASAFRDTTTTTLHVQIPIGTTVSRDQWVNLVFDLQALTEHYFPGSSYRSMESICISGSCRLKRIFTMKDAPYAQGMEEKLGAQMLAYKQQRSGSKDPSSVPTTVAGFAEMKEIPRQFLFSASPSCLPIPTEYFLVSAGREGSALTSPRLAPKPASRGGSRTRPAEKASAPVEKNENRVRSAPTDRVANARLDKMGSPSGKSPEKVYHRVERQTTSASRRRHEGYRDTPTPPLRRSDHVFASSQRAFGHDHDSADEFDPSETEQAVEEEENAAVDGTRFLSPDPSPPRRSQQVATTSGTNGFVLPRSVVLSSTMSERKHHRQHVMAEIQSKLDQLTKEGEEEEERDRAVFLDHTSLNPSIGAAKRSVTQTTAREFPRQALLKVAQLFTFPTEILAHKQQELPHTSLRNDWPDNDLLRSPEPMVLRRVHAAKKPELSFSSSIFTFNRGGSADDVRRPRQDDAEASESHSDRRLFDWDSLLEDSVGVMSITSTMGEKEGTGFSASAVAGVANSGTMAQADPSDKKSTDGVKTDGCATSRDALEVHSTVSSLVQDGDASSDDEREDAALCEMLAVKRRARSQVPCQPVAEEASALRSDSAWEAIEPRMVVTSERPLPQLLVTSDEDVEASFDFSLSPARSVLDPQTNVGERGSGFDGFHESSRSSESEGGLSLDITSALPEYGNPSSRLHDVADDEALTSPVNSDSEGERSFNFDDVVVHDRHTETRAIRKPARDSPRNDHGDPSTNPSTQSALTLAPRAAASDSPHTRPSEVTSTGSPLLRNSTPPREKSSRMVAKKMEEIRDQHHASSSSLRAMSSSDLRLASLLESTDWSQLPLASVVSSKPREERERRLPSNATREKTSETVNPSSSSLELIYDPILRCYYDPVGKKYYALAK